ncbi:hypothetical protein DPMN_121866 [Dreissena polymorpha]|uniref:Transmembrane protein n=1 Tax=Dreissena polymorpha TaxID=45954 RepID=A0A9D4GNL0_DREPO|nr:hypothetical protein DPMN_121866 [Dreissena polymorpha]
MARAIQPGSTAYVSSVATSASDGQEYTQDEGRGVISRVFPPLPMCMAVVCCVLNFLLPGLGSMLASVCGFCLAPPNDMTRNDKFRACCEGCSIGLLQFMLVPIFFVGWFLSCMAGLGFIQDSHNFYKMLTQGPEATGHVSERSEMTDPDNRIRSRGAALHLANARVVSVQPAASMVQLLRLPSYSERSATPPPYSEDTTTGASNTLSQNHQRHSSTNGRRHSLVTLISVVPAEVALVVPVRSPPPPYSEIDML